MNTGRILRLAFFLVAIAPIGISSRAAEQASVTQESQHALCLVLIKSTLTAVNHGNITGNYAVLRELGSAQFKQQFTPADLATSFSKLRSQKVDLSPILVKTPEFSKKPYNDEVGRLHLEGYFYLGTHHVHFHLVYKTLSHGWLIDHITIGMMAEPQHAARPGATVNAALQRF